MDILFRFNPFSNTRVPTTLLICKRSPLVTPLHSSFALKGKYLKLKSSKQRQFKAPFYLP